MLITLTTSELRLAGYAGMDRFVRAVAAGRRDNYGAPPNMFDSHVIGAWGEIAVARATDHYWAADRGKPDRGAADVGPYHVRTGAHPGCHLLLHHPDQDDEPFVFVVLHKLPVLEIVGWCNGEEGKRPEYWKTGREPFDPCYFVPSSILRPLP